MKNHKIWWQSSYDRGLDILLAMWPRVLEVFPDATLDVAYGWDLFVKGYSDNPERMAWKAKVDEGLKQKGITHHGRVGKKQLHDIRKECGIWAYPTYFTEINCIGALEAQHDGLVPVVINLAALDETVGTGVKIKGDIYDSKVRKEYLDALLDMMSDEKKWEAESKKGPEFAKKYSWDIIAGEWKKYL